MGKFVISKAKTGLKFNLVAGNGEIILSSQVYKTKATCKKGIASIQRIADSPVEDQTVAGYKTESKPKYELYLDKKKEYRFRLIARNGQIVGSGEGYKTRDACKNGITSIKKNADSQIVDETVEEKKAPAAKKAEKAAAPKAKACGRKCAKK
ncbi:MAG: YegP family protein [Treponema sp.]|nr:YegP family protein [Treponema sp.]